MQVKVAALTLTVLALFVATALISAFLLHDHHTRKVFVGSAGLATSVALYGAPLVAVVSFNANSTVRPFNSCAEKHIKSSAKHIKENKVLEQRVKKFCFLLNF